MEHVVRFGKMRKPQNIILKETNDMENLGVYGKIILHEILRKCGDRIRIVLICLRTRARLLLAASISVGLLREQLSISMVVSLHTHRTGACLLYCHLNCRQ
jgi:hypothetical protein